MGAYQTFIANWDLPVRRFIMTQLLLLAIYISHTWALRTSEKVPSPFLVIKRYSGYAQPCIVHNQSHNSKLVTWQGGQVQHRHTTTTPLAHPPHAHTNTHGTSIRLNSLCMVIRKRWLGPTDDTSAINFVPGPCADRSVLACKELRLKNRL